MNHLKVYNSIINNAKNREITNALTGYSECHHIIPSCLNGGNNPENLVRLTPEEHYLCHLLLCYIYPNKPKLFYAWNMMRNLHKGKAGRREYRILKEQFSIINSLNLMNNTHALGSKRTPEQIHKASRIHIGNSYRLGAVCTPETRAKMSVSAKLRTDIVSFDHTEEAKIKISQGLIKYYKCNKSALLGYQHTEISKINMSNGHSNSEYTKSGQRSKDVAERMIGNTWNSGRKHLKTPCVYCEQEVSNATKSIWHGPTPGKGDPDTSKCRLKSLQLGKSWSTTKIEKTILGVVNV